MPSYSQYKRQMAVMDADDANIETWITVKGNHIPIMKGQSKEEAVQSFLEKKGKSSGGSKSSGGVKTVMKPDIEKPGSTTVVSKGSGKAKYKVGDVTKQGKIKEVIPARLSDTPYYKLENGKTYLEEELKPSVLGKERKLSNGGSTFGLSKKEHEKIEKYNKWASKFDDQYKGDKAAFAKTQKILEGKGTREETERMVKSIEKTLGKEAGAKAREKFASILNKPAKKDFSSGSERPKGAKFNTTTKVPTVNREEFMKSQKKKYDTVTGTENGTLLSLYYEKGSKPSKHVGTYNHQTGEYFHNVPGAEKPAKKVSQSLKDDVDYYFTERQADEKAWKHWNKIREGVINKRGEGVFKDIRAVQNTGYYTPTEILNALEDGKKFDDMVSQEKEFQARLRKKEKPAKINPLEPQTREQARLWLADTLASTEGFTEANFSKEDKAMLKKMDEKFGKGWWETKSSKPANKGWMNARSSHPETIGKVVRRVVKKMGEARKENSWTMGDGTKVSVKNGVVTFNKNGKTKTMSEKEWAKLSKNPPSGSARGIFDD